MVPRRKAANAGASHPYSVPLWVSSGGRVVFPVPCSLLRAGGGFVSSCLRAFVIVAPGRFMIGASISSARINRLFTILGVPSLILEKTPFTKV
jgi:hypothetical protein